MAIASTNLILDGFVLRCYRQYDCSDINNQKREATGLNVASGTGNPIHYAEPQTQLIQLR